MFGNDQIGSVDVTVNASQALVFAKQYYVKDHLGSIRRAALVNGSLISARNYYPYGETMQEYQSGTKNRKYRFTGKERDDETNQDYFGARYYDSELGRWNTVDPMAEKYPEWSPYNYCINRPLNVIDPDGRTIWISIGENDENGKPIFRKHKNGKLINSDGSEYKTTSVYATNVVNDLNSLLSLNNPIINERINALINSDNDHKIFEPYLAQTEQSCCSSDQPNAANRGESTGTQIPYERVYGTFEGGISDWPQATLMHEIQHAYDYDKGRMAGEKNIKRTATDPAEIRGVQMENVVRNIVTPGQLRTTYGDKIDFPQGKKIADK